MLLRKRVKAGILLYALFLLAIFTLLLQFYLNRLETNQLLSHYQKESLQAQLLAEITKQEADEEKGTFSFSHGQSQYRYGHKGLFVEVQLSSGAVYQYQFAKFLPEDDEPQEIEKTDNKEEEVVAETDDEQKETDELNQEEEVIDEVEIDEEEIEENDLIDEDIDENEDEFIPISFDEEIEVEGTDEINF